MTHDLSYRNTASFGKRQEYHVIGELLRWGYDVYQTLVDDKQIDCIIRKGDIKPNYVDIQIKARSKTCSRKDAGRFANLTIEHPRKNYFFMFYCEDVDKIWIIPSSDIVNELGSKTTKPESKHLGKWAINMAGYSKKEKRAIWNGKTSKRFEKYESDNGSKLLDALLDSS